LGGNEASGEPRGSFTWKQDFKYDIFDQVMPVIAEYGDPSQSAIKWIEIPKDYFFFHETLLRIHGKAVERYIYRNKSKDGPTNRNATVMLTYAGRPFCILDPEFFDTFVHIIKSSSQLVITESMSGTGAYRNHLIYTFSETKPVLIKTLSGSRHDANADTEIYK
jgi:hypothetical protein